MRERNLPLTMIRPTLSGLPAYDVPEHHSIRPYASGDEWAWVAIQRAADRYNTIDPSLFAREFGSDLEALQRRLSFLVGPAGEAIGTAAAWFGEAQREGSFGRVHWVAVHPAHQGRGLAKGLLHHVCVALRELGYRRAYLRTSSARIAAIRLYLRFGFVPEVERSEEASAWAAVAREVPGLGRLLAAGPPRRHEGTR